MVPDHHVAITYLDHVIDDPMFWKALFYEESDLAKRFLKRLTRYLQSMRQVGRKDWWYFCSHAGRRVYEFYLDKIISKDFQIVWIWAKVGSSGCLRPLAKSTKVIALRSMDLWRWWRLRSNRWRKSVKSRISLIEVNFSCKIFQSCYNNWQETYQI